MNFSNSEILNKINERCRGTLMETLGIVFTEIDPQLQSLTATMPVNERVYQPDGVLHGGATVALAESVGSCAAFVFLNNQQVVVRGIEISANHVKSVREGIVRAVAEIIHPGKTTQLWQIKIYNTENELVSLCKLTTITLARK
jgi:1,4-dihydroxy-2-naphthoyl-CoA hydrolase